MFLWPTLELYSEMFAVCAKPEGTSVWQCEEDKKLVECLGSLSVGLVHCTFSYGLALWCELAYDTVEFPRKHATPWAWISFIGFGLHPTKLRDPLVST